MEVTRRGFCACAVIVCSILTTLTTVGCAGADARSARALDIRDPESSDTAPPARAMAATAPPATAPKLMSAQAPHAEPPPPSSRVVQLTKPSVPKINVALPAKSRDIRVMSFNIRREIFIDALNHWQFRKRLLVETIRNFNPDLLGTQEALAEQADYLREQLDGYDFVGVGRSDGKRGGEMCGVFYRKSRFEKLDAGSFWLSETPQRPGSKSWGTSFTRMCTWVKLRDRTSGDVLCLFNTHFDHRGKRAREESAVLLRHKLEQIAGRLPVIITGDFNTTDDTAPYYTLIAGTRRGDPLLTDTYRAANRAGDASADGTIHNFRGGQGGPRIDWIVTSGAFRTISAGIDHTQDGGRYPSDHFPVTAVLRPAPRVGVARAE
jgi:endonuclease/exonuclease/phosphatase family metal-dependent hydrolase